MKQWKLVKVFPLRTFTNFCPIKMFTRFNSGKHLNNIWFLTIFDLCKSQRLYNLDARKIAVFNAPKVGLIPFERDVHLCDQACLSLLNRMAMLYNCKLKNLLEDLTGNLSGSAIVYVDYYAVMEDIINNYRSYGEVFQQWTLNLGFGRVMSFEIWYFFHFSGFEKDDHACCEVIGAHGGLIPCISSSRVCPDRTEYIFWDPFHPTESAALIGSKYALDGGLKYASPINIRQLANSWWHLNQWQCIK